MEPTGQPSQEANVDPGPNAGVFTLLPYQRHAHAEEEEGGDHSSPPEHSEGAYGETRVGAAGDKPGTPCCGVGRRSEGREEALRPRLPEHVVCVPAFLRHFSDASPSARTRLYQVWPGKNVFFLRGHIICGPDPRGFLLTVVSILLSIWIFCFYVASDSPEASTPIITSSLILALLVMVSLIMVAATDPGIVPRNRLPPPWEEADTSQRRRSRRISVDGVETKQKYCRVCRVFRPPRSCHCAVCDNCVERFDHHCPWVGQCVGLRNYRFYVLFISSGLVFFLYVLAFACRRVGRVAAGAGTGVLVALRVAPETVALGLFSAVVVWFLGGLLVFHCYLILVNQTARENFKQRYKGSPNPYDKGVLRNIKEALFVLLPPSKVDFREEICPSSISGAGAAILRKDEEAAAAAAAAGEETLTTQCSDDDK